MKIFPWNPKLLQVKAYSYLRVYDGLLLEFTGCYLIKGSGRLA